MVAKAKPKGEPPIHPIANPPRSGPMSLEDVVQLAARVEFMWRQAMNNCLFYIKNYVMIEDKDSPDPVCRFEIWPKQEEALDVFLHHRLSIVLKARQLGLSWLSIAYASWRIVFRPGYTVIALSKREDEALELVRRMRFILKYLPKWMIQEKKYASKDFSGPVWEATTSMVTIYHPDSEPATFKSFTSSEDSARSFTANLVILDEWAFQQFAGKIWSAAFPTINRPGGGQVIGISTAKMGTFFEETWDGAVIGKNDFKPVFLPWWSDPRRTQEWYDNTRRNLPHSYLQEYPSTPEEAFSVGEMTAFPEFDIDVHVCPPFPIPSHWRRWMAVDNGYDDPFWWGWLAVSEDGDVYLYREFTRSPGEPKLTYSEQAAKVAELCTYVRYEGGMEIPFLEPLDYIVCGKDAWNTHHRDVTGKNLIDYYLEGGLRHANFIPAITDRRLRKVTMHEYLRPEYDANIGKYRAKLTIFSSCSTILDTLPRLPKDEKDPEKVADCSIDHCLTGDTLIDTIGGQAAIRDLVGKEGLVHCYNEELEAHTVARFFDVHKTAADVPVFEVTLDDGRSFKATDYHPVLTSEGWKLVSELQPGDEIVDIGPELIDH